MTNAEYKEVIQNQMNQIAMLTIERILKSGNVPTLEGKIKLIEYVVGATNQTIPDMEFNV
jgi:copper homeostasis protein CutC